MAGNHGRNRSQIGYILLGLCTGAVLAGVKGTPPRVQARPTLETTEVDLAATDLAATEVDLAATEVDLAATALAATALAATEVDLAATEVDLNGLRSGVVALRANVAPPPVARPTVLYLGGDVLPSAAMRRAFEERAVQRGTTPADELALALAPLSAVFGSDPGAEVLVNLEMPIATTRYAPSRFAHLRGRGRRVPTPLNAPPFVAEGLKLAGVTSVALANNHALDQRREGLAETLSVLDRVSLNAVGGAGAGEDPGAPLIVGDVPNRVLVFNRILRDFDEPSLDSDKPTVAVLRERILPRVEAASRHGKVVVFVHVTSELRRAPKPEWEDWANRLAAAGASVVAFHGTHVVGPIAYLEGTGQGQVVHTKLDLAPGRISPNQPRHAGTVVFYGLGNLMADMGMMASPDHDDDPLHRGQSKWRHPGARAGMVLRIEAHGDHLRVAHLPVWTHHDRWRKRSREKIDTPINFTVTPLFDGPQVFPLDLVARGYGDRDAKTMAQWVGRIRDRVFADASFAPTP